MVRLCFNDNDDDLFDITSNTTSISLSLFAKKLEIQAFEIDNSIIPIQDFKTKDIKTLALQYFPNEYCQKQFDTSYIEEEKRCETKEEKEKQRIEEENRIKEIQAMEAKQRIEQYKADNIGFFLENNIGFTYTYIKESSFTITYNNKTNLLNNSTELLNAHYNLGMGVFLYNHVPLLKTNINTNFKNLFVANFGFAYQYTVSKTWFSFEFAYYPFSYVYTTDTFLKNTHYSIIGNINPVFNSPLTFGLGIRIFAFNVNAIVSNKIFSIQAGVTLPLILPFSKNSSYKYKLVGF